MYAKVRPFFNNSEQFRVQEDPHYATLGLRCYTTISLLSTCDRVNFTATRVYESRYKFALVPTFHVGFEAGGYSRFSVKNKLFGFRHRFCIKVSSGACYLRIFVDLLLIECTQLKGFRFKNNQFRMLSLFILNESNSVNLALE